MHVFRFSARQAATATATGAALLLGAGCGAKSTLLDAPIPTVIDPSAANSPAGADALRLGALSRLRQITAGSGSGDSPWMFAGLLTDEWKSSDTFSQRNETDQRLDTGQQRKPDIRFCAICTGRAPAPAKPSPH